MIFKLNKIKYQFLILSLLFIMFCKYKDIFGKPGEGAHATRFANLAIVDVFFTIIAGIIIAYFLNYNVYMVVGLLFLLGIIAHRLFCVRTTVDKLLFD